MYAYTFCTCSYREEKEWPIIRLGTLVASKLHAATWSITCYTHTHTHKHFALPLCLLCYKTHCLHCDYRYIGYHCDFSLSSLHRVSPLALNHIYLSLSNHSSMNLSPGIQPTPTCLYLAIALYKSLCMYQPGVPVVSNTVPGLLQTQISISRYLPPVSDRPVSMHWQKCFLLVIILKSVCRAKDRARG